MREYMTHRQWTAMWPEKKREHLQRKADAALRPRAPQAPCDHGLFGDESAQTDFVDIARRLTPRKS